jgi:hypothetical protein
MAWNDAATTALDPQYSAFLADLVVLRTVRLALIGAVYGFERYRLGQARHPQPNSNGWLPSAPKCCVRAIKVQFWPPP